MFGMGSTLPELLLAKCFGGKPRAGGSTEPCGRSSVSDPGERGSVSRQIPFPGDEGGTPSSGVLVLADEKPRCIQRKEFFCDYLCVFWELPGTRGVLGCYRIPCSQTRRSLARCFRFDAVRLSSWLASQPG